MDDRHIVLDDRVMFRVWNKPSKLMWLDVMPAQFSGVFVLQDDSPDTDYWLLSECVVEMATPNKDVDDQRIYVGDIVSVFLPYDGVTSYIGEVVRDDQCDGASPLSGEFKITVRDDLVFSESGASVAVNANDLVVKVIGNIHRPLLISGDLLKS